MNYNHYPCPYFNNSYYGYGFRGDGNMQMQPTRAVANIQGGPLAPSLRGTVIFADVPGGTEVSVEVQGLPPYKPAEGGKPPVGPHGFHIHQNGSCVVGDPSDPFKPAGEHWNPTNQPHGT
jgi:Cu-Zn family superoxide dismutase